MLTPFHLAIPVHDLKLAREFYGQVIGCEEGRSSDHWIDFNLFGHQLVCHLSDSAKPADISNPVDGHDVPIPHFGVVLTMPVWESFRDRLQAQQVRFDIEPYIRFEGQAGEQATLFFRDPSGNALEFKAFRNIDSELFRK